MPSSSERYPHHADEALRRGNDTPGKTLADFYNQPRTRRNALGIGAMTVTTLYMGAEADTKYAAEHNHRKNLDINMIESSHNKLYEHHSILFIPPYNFLSADAFAAAVKDTVAEHGNVSSLSHDTTGFSIENCVAQINNYMDRYDQKTLTICGSSVGGLIATVAAARLPNVTHLIIDSAPADIGNVKNLPGLLSPELAAIADELGLTGGPLTRGTVEFIKRLQDGNKSLHDCFVEAASKMGADECPNALDVDLFWFLATHTALAQRNRLSKIDIDYLGAANPADDTLVDQPASSATYRELAADIGSYYSWYTSKGTGDNTGHSDIPHHPKAYSKMLSESLGDWTLRHAPRHTSYRTI